MANYHVSCSTETNKIYAGTINKKADKWVNKSDVTEETILAVRQHFMNIMAIQEEPTDTLGYRWENENGKDIILQVVVKDRDDPSQ